MSLDLTSIFYPTSPPKVVDPDKAAALLAEQYSQSPNIGIIDDFAEFIIESTLSKPEHADSLIQTALILSRNKSLPTAYWTRDRPKSTFDEVFNVAFRDKIHACLLVDEASERPEFLNGSFIAGRARSLGLLTSPETVGAVEEGLNFRVEANDDSTREIAEIRALGACLQLLASARELIELGGESFAVEKIINSLQGISVSEADKSLVDLTIRHLQSTLLKDMTSSEIVQRTRSAGWSGLCQWVDTGAALAE